jgi:hypothetical protein
MRMRSAEGSSLCAPFHFCFGGQNYFSKSESLACVLPFTFVLVGKTIFLKAKGSLQKACAIRQGASNGAAHGGATFILFWWLRQSIETT